MQTLNVFELVNEVLESTYAEIPATDDAQRDAWVSLTLQYLRDYFAKLKNAPGGPDYRQPQVRFAYIFAYVTCHANLVASRVAECPELQAVFARERASVTCLGGGPGSDLVGVLKYALAQPRRPNLLCYLCDRESKWSDSWADVGQRLGTALTLTAQPLEHDVTAFATWNPEVKTDRWLRSDMFTMIYFMSELYTHRAQATDYFRFAMASAKSGAAFLYVDNQDSGFTGWFESIAAEYGAPIVYRGDEVVRMPFHEEKGALLKWTKKFADARPKLNASVSYRVAIKP